MREGGPAERVRGGGAARGILLARVTRLLDLAGMMKQPV